MGGEGEGEGSSQNLMQTALLTFIHGQTVHGELWIIDGVASGCILYPHLSYEIFDIFDILKNTPKKADAFNFYEQCQTDMLKAGPR